jgi:hypothetical protein
MFKTLSQGGYTSKEYIIYEEKIYNGFMFEVKFFSYSIQPSIHQWSQILCPTNILRLMVKCTYSKMSHHLSLPQSLHLPLFSHFLSVFLSICFSLSISPSELVSFPFSHPLSLPSLSFSCSPSLLASLRIILISFS